MHNIVQTSFRKRRCLFLHTYIYIFIHDYILYHEIFSLKICYSAWAVQLLNIFISWATEAWRWSYLSNCNFPPCNFCHYNIWQLLCIYKGTFSKDFRPLVFFHNQRDPIIHNQICFEYKFYFTKIFYFKAHSIHLSVRGRNFPKSL
jgi:hypothetical protein